MVVGHIAEMAVRVMMLLLVVLMAATSTTGYSPVCNVRWLEFETRVEVSDKVLGSPAVVPAVEARP